VPVIDNWRIYRLSPGISPVKQGKAAVKLAYHKAGTGVVEGLALSEKWLIHNLKDHPFPSSLIIKPGSRFHSCVCPKTVKN